MLMLILNQEKRREGKKGIMFPQQASLCALSHIPCALRPPILFYYIPAFLSPPLVIFVSFV